MRCVINVLLLLSFLVMSQIQLSAVEDGGSIFIYDDGIFMGLADVAKKELKEDLKKRKIKWNSKSKKSGTLLSINENIEKDVLKKKPSVVVLSFGLFDICDPKKGSLKEHDVDKMLSELAKAIARIKEQGAEVVVATPGLAGEDLSAEHQNALDAFSEALRGFATEQEVKLCDIRKKARAWVEANPPKKAGRLQLTKKGGKWDDKGEELLAGMVMGAVGLSKSGIKRALRWDERVVLATSIATWQGSIEKLIEPELRAAGPQEAPKGFFNPSVKGPDYIHASISDFERTDFEADRVKTQKATVLFLYPFDRIIKNTKYPAAPVKPRLEQAMELINNADYPGFVMTPYWYNEDGAKTLGEKGKRYQRCKEIAEMTREVAAKHGVPVVDLFAKCEAMHAADNNVVFWGLYKADNKQLVMSDAGKRLMADEIKRVLGVLKEE